MLTKEDVDIMWEEHPRYSQSGRAAQDSQANPREGLSDAKGIFGLTNPPPTSESDPNGKSAKEPGSKLDAGKSPVFQGLLSYFPAACVAVANVSRLGAEKYAWKGWESVPDGFNRYSDALGRHLCAEGTDGPIDSTMKDSDGSIAGVYHASQVAWNALARLELLLKESQKNIKGN